MPVTFEFDHQLITTAGTAGPYGNITSMTAVKNGRYFYCPERAARSTLGDRLAVFDRGAAAAAPAMTFLGLMAAAGAGLKIDLSTRGSVSPNGELMILPQGQPAALNVYDLSNPAAPAFLGQVFATHWPNTPGVNDHFIRGIYWIDNETILVHIERSALSAAAAWETIDVSSPLAPTSLSLTTYQSFNFPSVQFAVNAATAKAYSSGGSFMWDRCDFANPAAITRVIASAGFTLGNTQPSSFETGDDLIDGRYLLNHRNQGSGLLVETQDANHATPMSTVASHFVPGVQSYWAAGRYGVMTPDRDYLFQTAGATGVGTNPRLVATDITNPLSTFDDVVYVPSGDQLTRMIGDLYFEDGFVYVPIGNSGATRLGWEVYKVPELWSLPIIGRLSVLA